MKIAIFLLVLATPLVTHAQEISWGGIKSLKCTFTEGANFNGKEMGTTNTPFGDDPTLVIDSINVVENTARYIGNAGADDLVILEAAEMLTAVDRTDSGNWIFYSISPALDDNYYITTSRHVVLLGQPIFSQSYGTCEVWN